jgi:hypothetical protein
MHPTPPLLGCSWWYSQEHDQALSVGQMRRDAWCFGVLFVISMGINLRGFPWVFEFRGLGEDSREPLMDSFFGANCGEFRWILTSHPLPPTFRCRVVALFAQTAVCMSHLSSPPP